MPHDILFIHSAGSQSGEGGSVPFVRALRRALGPEHRLASPSMPAPDQPSYTRWKGALHELLARGPAPSILVGHSLGGSVLLKYLAEERPPHRFRGLFVVASPFWGSGDWQVDEFRLQDGFADALPEDLPVFLYQSRDDEVVEGGHLARYARAIPQATAREVEAGGHTFAAGLPALVADIRRLTGGPG